MKTTTLAPSSSPKAVAGPNATVGWPEIFKLCKRDSAGRYWPKTPFARAYIEKCGIRTPSRAWPHSYAKALMSKRFARSIIAHYHTANLEQAIDYDVSAI